MVVEMRERRLGGVSRQMAMWKEIGGVGQDGIKGVWLTGGQDMDGESGQQQQQQQQQQGEVGRGERR